MLKYMVVPLCDSAVSYCHYDGRKERRLLDLETLRKAVRFSMIENLTVQFVFPDYEIPKEYLDVIEEVEYGVVRNIEQKDKELKADVWVSEGSDFLKKDIAKETYLWRVKMNELLGTDVACFAEVLKKAERVNVVVTDVDGLSEEDLTKYGEWLEKLADEVAKMMKEGNEIKCNLITDRVSLEKMNNCNAGDESIALMPDGKFYVCPAFYYDRGESVGDIDNGINIPNKQLYKIENAPICRTCDAWQCRRCVWLNEKMTLEVNTPSREQCVMAHLERKAGRRLAEAIGTREIKVLGYVDPFEEVVKKN